MGQSTAANADPMRAIEGERFGFAEARHLLMRAGFGGTPEQIRTLAAWGPERAVEHLLDCGATDAYGWPGENEFDGTIIKPLKQVEQREFKRARETQDEDTVARFRERRQKMQREDRKQAKEVQRWWLGRLIESPRPLEEKMTLFWHGHFATSYRKTENSYHMFQQNQLFRSHALGNFGSLLHAIIHDPATLKYLDNIMSSKEEPNENLARELMELFSLGEGNYAERDIREGARALTGYTYRGNDFLYRRGRHDTGVKRILGKSGALDGDGFVMAILEQRVCAEFIASKLYRFFVGEIPEGKGQAAQGVRRFVRRMAGTLRGSKYAVRPMMRELLLSEHFYDAEHRLTKIKSPAELVIGAIRSLRTPTRSLDILNEAMKLMGQSLFMPPSVKGWDGGRAWINTSTLYVRQNVMTYLLTGVVPSGVGGGRGGMMRLAGRKQRRGGGEDRYDPKVVLRGLGAGTGDIERAAGELLTFMLGGEVNEERHGALVAFAREAEGESFEHILIGMMSLVAVMPEYQLT